MFVAKLMLVTLVSQLVLSTLLIAQIIYGHNLDAFESFNVKLVLTFQIVIICVSCETLAYITVAVHRSSGLIYRAQMMLKSEVSRVVAVSENAQLKLITFKTTLAKLKLAVYYELVHSEARKRGQCCFHLGTFASVTKKSCLDVS